MLRKNKRLLEDQRCLTKLFLKEMSVLIDGVISECKDLGIETMPPDELALLKSKWGKA